MWRCFLQSSSSEWIKNVNESFWCSYVEVCSGNTVPLHCIWCFLTLQNWTEHGQSRLKPASYHPLATFKLVSLNCLPLSTFSHLLVDTNLRGLLDELTITDNMSDANYQQVNQQQLKEWVRPVLPSSFQYCLIILNWHRRKRNIIRR